MVPLNGCLRRWRSESGAELVEFALTLPLLLLIVLGIMEFGLIFQQYEVVTNAAREGARIAVLAPIYSKSDAEQRVRDYLTAGGLDATLVPPAVGDPYSPPLGSGACISVVDVHVDYPHSVLFLGGIARFFGGVIPGIIHLKATSTMRMEATAASCP